jgi:hypothetical protein
LPEEIGQVSALLEKARLGEKDAAVLPGVRRERLLAASPFRRRTV